jgi:hypothetical protein
VRGFENALPCPKRVDGISTYASSTGNATLYCSQWDFSEQSDKYIAKILPASNGKSQSVITFYGCSSNPSVDNTSQSLSYGPYLGLPTGLLHKPSYLSGYGFQPGNGERLDLTKSIAQENGEHTRISYRVSSGGVHPLAPSSTPKNHYCFSPAVGFASHNIVTYNKAPAVTLLDLIGTMGGTVSALIGIRTLIVSLVDKYMKASYGPQHRV